MTNLRDVKGMPDGPIDRDARRLMVPVAVVVAAVILTASVVLGTQRLVAAEVEGRLAPLVREMREMKDGQKAQTEAIDALRLEMARRQGAEK